MNQRQTGLDVLRGVAILMVVLHHLNRGVWKGFLPKAIGEGWTGVDLFFVLSGFLVSRSLVAWLAEGKTARRYAVRRLVRILPVAWFWAALCVGAAALFSVSEAFGPFSQVRDEFWAILTFSYNYYAVQSGHAMLMWFWSLAVEEHFYLLLPLALVTVRSPRLRVTALVGAASLVWAGRVGARLFADAPYGDLTLLSHFRADGLLLGSALGCWWANGGRSKLSPVPGWLPALLWAYLWVAPAYFSRDLILNAGIFSFAAVSVGLVVLAASSEELLPVPKMWVPFFAALGRRSYTLYLVHIPILRLLRVIRFELWGIPQTTRWDQAGLAMLEFSAFLLLAGLVTEVGYRGLELPFARWAKRL